ncbi:MAG TPA: GNAT family N-acetyltransferase [Gaiellaceae bacterium]
MRDELVYMADSRHATVLRVRAANLDWVREESRGLERVEWWVGWSAPPEIPEQLLTQGLVPDNVPVLRGMTCTVEPPEAPHVEVRQIITAADHAEAVEVDWEVWQVDEEERAKRRATQRVRFEEDEASGVVHQFSALLDGRRVGFGRAIDMEDGVALMGGTVLPEARGCGVYRALVRARWEHAVSRGTPLLVVQAGDMSTPVLDGLGFVGHGEIRLFVDRL